MNELTPLAQVCVTLIEGKNITMDNVPPIVKDEVLQFYKKGKEEGEDVDV